MDRDRFLAGHGLFRESQQWWTVACAVPFSAHAAVGPDLTGLDSGRNAPCSSESSNPELIQYFTYWNENMSSNTLSRISAVVLSVFLLIFATSAPAAGEHGGGHGDDNGHGTDMTNQDGHGNGGHGHEGGHSFAFGSPASPSEADRTVEVEANDRMKFVPETIAVKEGELVRCVIQKVGQLQHSLTLAKPAEQKKHEKEMKGMAVDRMASHMDDDPNVIVVQGGETGSLTWRFTEAMAVQFACHIPGHYDAGMKGRMRIQ
jgi:uncharacterized cupredoxin-like copper-binding protein